MHVSCRHKGAYRHVRLTLYYRLVVIGIQVKHVARRRSLLTYTCDSVGYGQIRLADKRTIIAYYNVLDTTRDTTEYTILKDSMLSLAHGYINLSSTHFKVGSPCESYNLQKLIEFL